jgi:glyoxylase-like metal-dependent hydrolase (beta-lactamase superfamily II)
LSSPSPFQGEGDKGSEVFRQPLKSLERLKELEIEVIVPGHGPLRHKSEIEQNIKNLTELMGGRKIYG